MVMYQSLTESPLSRSWSMQPLALVVVVAAAAAVVVVAVLSRKQARGCAPAFTHALDRRQYPNKRGTHARTHARTHVALFHHATPTSETPALPISANTKMLIHEHHPAILVAVTTVIAVIAVGHHIIRRVPSVFVTPGIHHHRGNTAASQQHLSNATTQQQRLLASPLHAPHYHHQRRRGRTFSRMALRIRAGIPMRGVGLVCRMSAGARVP